MAPLERRGSLRKLRLVVVNEGGNEGANSGMGSGSRWEEGGGPDRWRVAWECGAGVVGSPIESLVGVVP